MDKSIPLQEEESGSLAIDLGLCCIALQQPISPSRPQQDAADCLVRAKRPVDLADDHQQGM